MTGLPNPLIAGFNPDPSIVRVDGVYWLVTSTFEYLPGIPVYRSDDLIEWQHVGEVIERSAQAIGIPETPTNGGVWAPTIRWHNGRFFVIVTIAMGRGCMVYSTLDPASGWDDGVLIDAIEGIDPDLAWDDEGVAIVTYSALVTVPGPDFGHHGGIRQADVDLATGRILDGPRDLWSGTGRKFPEAPHLYRRDGAWYLLIAEGGTERGHGASIARGADPRGPFERGPANPFMTAVGTDNAIQNAGHGDFVEGPDGQSLLVHLGVRPRGATAAFSALGRETFVTPVTWVDGWPQAEPPALAPRASGDLEIHAPVDGALASGWIGVRRFAAELADLESAPGRITLHGEGADLTHDQPVFLGRRQRHQTASASTSVEANEDAVGGIAVRYDERSVYSLLTHVDASGQTVVAEARVPGVVQQWSVRLPRGPLDLELDAHRPNSADFADAMTSDRIRFVVRQGETEHELADVDGRHLSAEAATSFTGRVIGLVAVEGKLTFDALRYRGTDD